MPKKSASDANSVNTPSPDYRNMDVNSDQFKLHMRELLTQSSIKETTIKSYQSGLRRISEATGKNTIHEIASIPFKTFEAQINSLTTKRKTDQPLKPQSLNTYISGFIVSAKKLNVPISPDLQEYYNAGGSKKKADMAKNDGKEKFDVEEVPQLKKVVEDHIKQSNPTTLQDAMFDFLLTLYTFGAPQRGSVFENAEFVNGKNKYNKEKDRKKTAIFDVENLMFFTPTQKVTKRKKDKDGKVIEVIEQPIEAEYNHPVVRKALDRYLKVLQYDNNQGIMLPNPQRWKRGQETESLVSNRINKYVKTAFQSIGKKYNVHILRRMSSTADGMNPSLNVTELRKRASAMGHSLEMHLMYRVIPNVKRTDEAQKVYDQCLDEMQKIITRVQNEPDKKKLKEILELLQVTVGGLP